MSSAFTTHLRRVRRATTGRTISIAALVVCIIVILVAAPQAHFMAGFGQVGGGGIAAVASAQDGDFHERALHNGKRMD